ncbi:MAG: hypothetical protein M3300_04690 [Actinomycetota bacterium]|nr:hypothetical protein [Actinomycetota bacterium]
MLHPALAGLVPPIRRTGAAVGVSAIDSAEQVRWWRELGADSRARP